MQYIIICLISLTLSSPALADTLLGKVGKIVEGEEIFTEISESTKNGVCGEIKYSILNLGVDYYGGNYDHLTIKVLDEKGKAVFEGDSTSLIKLACKDITDDGRPELIVDTWGGGNCGCCNSFFILTSKNSGDKPHLHVLLSSEGFRGIKDEDADGIFEVNTCQWSGYGENGKKGNSYLNQTKCLMGDKYIECQLR